MDARRCAVNALDVPELLGAVLDRVAPVAMLRLCAFVSRSWRDAVAAIAIRRSRTGPRPASWASDGSDARVHTGRLARTALIRLGVLPPDDAIPNGPTLCGALAALDFARCLRWVRSMGCPWDASSLAAAAFGGRDDTVRWMIERTDSPPCPWDERACEAAAYGGRISVIELLLAAGCPCDPIQVAWVAGCSGRYRIVEWLDARGLAWQSPGPLRLAARDGLLDTARWLASRGCQPTMSVLAAAANRGRLDVLVWVASEMAARGYGCRILWEELHSAAAAGGHLHVVRWLRDGGHKWSYHAPASAAENGHTEVMRWIIHTAREDKRAGREANAYLNDMEAGIASAAARGGRVDTIVACAELGHAPGPDEAVIAAASGHADALRWMIGASRACDGDGGILQPKHARCICLAAAQRGSIAVLDVLREEGIFDAGCAPGDPKPCRVAAVAGATGALKWLVEHGFAWHPVAAVALAAGGDAAVLRWAAEHELPWGELDPRDLLRYGQRFRARVLELAPLLTQLGCPWRAIFFVTDAHAAAAPNHSDRDPPDERGGCARDGVRGEDSESRSTPENEDGGWLEPEDIERLLLAPSSGEDESVGGSKWLASSFW